MALLGPVEVRRDGAVLALPAGLTTELLARLAVEPGSFVRAETLLDELWNCPAGRNTLQSKVSQLRRALGGAEVVLAGVQGYALDVPSDTVDAVVAAGLAAKAAAARDTGDPAAALAHASAALDLFRGEPLVDFGDWAAAHRVRLQELRLGLLETAMSARLDLGAGGEVVGELEALVAEHPWREGLWGCLITALYRSGRQADALAAYARLRRTLVDDLGIEPGPELQRLERQVLQQSPELGTPARAAVRPGNLPAPTSRLVGRDRDLAVLTQAVHERRLVTLTGPAGVGKTRLAVEAAGARTEAGGAWMVRLDALDPGLDDPAVLARVVAETMQVPGGDQALLERLAGSPTFLVLDNCEHLVASVASLARSLLDAVPSLRLLVTSQAPLGLADERVVTLEPLDAEASQALFADRAREMRTHFELDEDTEPWVAQVCASLDGLPLAIELAAARVRSLSVPDIARRLDDRFAVLRDPSSRRPERQRALAEAIAWSYDLLFPDDQRGLWALSCFAGGASLDAVERVLGALDVPSGVVLDTVSRLVDRSLVRLEDVGGGEVRYRLLDSIRLFAATRLDEAGLVPTAARAHAEWYAERADWCDRHVRGPDQPACVAFARAERADVDAALAWCAEHEPSLGTRIANGLGWTWVVLGDGVAGASRVRKALSVTATDRKRTQSLLLAGWLEASAGDVTLAAADLDGAGEAALRCGDALLPADVERHRAFLAIQQGRPDQVLVHAAAAVDVARERSLAWPTAAGLLLSAYGALMLGDTTSATADASEALGLLRPLGDSWGIVHAEAMLGGIAQAEHRFDDAAAALERAADESVALGFLGQAALHRATLARVLQRVGDPRAADTFGRAVDDAVSGGDGRLAATARVHLARLRRATGDLEAARALLEENQRWYGGAGRGDYALLTDVSLAALNDDAAALEAGRVAAREAGHPEVELLALDALARLTAASDPKTAAALLAEADALMADVAHALDESDRLDATVARELLAESA